MKIDKIKFLVVYLVLSVLGVRSHAASDVSNKPLDPYLNRFLAPDLKHAFGIRMVPKGLLKTLYQRYGRAPKFIVVFSDHQNWKLFRQSFQSKLRDCKGSQQTYIFTFHPQVDDPLPVNQIPQALRSKYSKDPANLKASSEGMYDAQWVWLGQLLNTCSQAQLDRVILRPGHEMNGSWYPHSTKPKGSTRAEALQRQAQYKAMWQRMHKIVMKELKGKRVLWDFCPSGGQIHSAATPPEVGNAYPGDEYVDIIGIDRYAGKVDVGDTGSGSWNEAKNSAFAWVSRFAAEHGKMTAVDETNVTWVPLPGGQHTGSDDYPEWFVGLAEWMQQEIDAHRLNHMALFELDTKEKFHACVARLKPIPGREHQKLNFPKSAAKILELFGGKLVSQSSVAAAPSSLKASTASSTQINLSWVDQANNEAGYKIERMTGKSGTYAQIATVATNIESYHNAGLASNTQYTYRVRATNAQGNSAYSNEANATTMDVAPAAPTGLTAIPVSSTQINLSWSDKSNNETGFKIERKTGSGGTFVQIATVTGNVKTFSNNGLAANTQYYYRVRATNAVGNSAYSNNAWTKTLAIINKPVIASSDPITSPVNESFQYQLIASGTPAIYGAAGLPIGLSMDPATGLISGTPIVAGLYDVTLSATNAGGTCNVTLKLTIKAVSMAEPVNLKAVVAGKTVNLAWSDNSTDETSFRVFRKDGVNGTWGYCARVEPNIHTYSDSPPQSQKIYFYRVRVRKGDSSTEDFSDWSNEVKVTLP